MLSRFAQTGHGMDCSITKSAFAFASSQISNFLMSNGNRHGFHFELIFVWSTNLSIIQLSNNTILKCSNLYGLYLPLEHLLSQNKIDVLYKRRHISL